MKKTSALCEMHPQLRLANLYIRTSFEGALVAQLVEGQNSVELLSVIDDSSPPLKLTTLTFPSSILQLLGNCIIQSTVFGGEYLHLRIPCGGPIGKKTSGSDTTEVIDFSSLTSDFKSPAKMHLPAPNEICQIQCIGCGTTLVSDAKFERILPLPRSSWSEAASDWYCHLHEGESAHPEIPLKRLDCLYGSSYHSLTTTSFVEGSIDLDKKRGWSCSKCQLSIALAGEGRVPLWCHSVQWQIASRKGDPWKSMPVYSPLEAFFFTLYDALEEEKSFFGRKLNFHDPATNSILHLWFVGDNSLTLEGRSTDTVVQLQLSALVRVLYKQNVNQSNIPCGNKLTDVSEYLISREMLDAAFDVLRSSSDKLPPSCRNAAGYVIGYLPLK